MLIFNTETMLIINSDNINIDFEDSNITTIDNVDQMVRAHRFSHICCEDSPQALRIR